MVCMCANVCLNKHMLSHRTYHIYRIEYCRIETHTIYEITCHARHMCAENYDRIRPSHTFTTALHGCDVIRANEALLWPHGCVCCSRICGGRQSNWHNDEFEVGGGWLVGGLWWDAIHPLLLVVVFVCGTCGHVYIAICFYGSMCVYKKTPMDSINKITPFCFRRTTKLCVYQQFVQSFVWNSCTCVCI